MEFYRIFCSLCENLMAYLQSFILPNNNKFILEVEFFFNGIIPITVNYHQIIGEGAYSNVYLGTAMGNIYAIKKILLQSHDIEISTHQEIKALKMFQHTNIIKLLGVKDAKEKTSKVSYLIFPYIKYGSLRSKLDRLELTTKEFDSKRLIPTIEILKDFLKICSALNVLHTHNPSYIHQDIKPDNILIAEDGNPLLTDFGSVRLADISIESRNQSLTIADQAAQFCTIPYRPPELFDPPRGAKLDSRCDVWSMGCLLFAWRFGYSPFECEFTDAGKLKITECSYSRVLSKIPKIMKPSKDDSIILEVVEWILQKDHIIRPFTSDVIYRVDEQYRNLSSGHQV